MDGITRKNLDEAFANACAYSEVVEAGEWVFLNFCVGNVGGSGKCKKGLRFSS